jgi:hypothetical protein
LQYKIDEKTTVTKPQQPSAPDEDPNGTGRDPAGKDVGRSDASAAQKTTTAIKSTSKPQILARAKKYDPPEEPTPCAAQQFANNNEGFCAQHKNCESANRG